MKTKDVKYEEDILASFEKGEWRSVPDLKDEIKRYAASAAATLSKDKRINIRLSSRDLEDIQMRAAEARDDRVFRTARNPRIDLLVRGDTLS